MSELQHERLEPEYPSREHLLNSLRVVVEYLRGRSQHSKRCLIHALWVCAGFAASMIRLDGPQPLWIGGDKNVFSTSAIADLEKVLADGEQAGSDLAGVDWLNLLRTILAILFREFFVS